MKVAACSVAWTKWGCIAANSLFNGHIDLHERSKVNFLCTLYIFLSYSYCIEQWWLFLGNLYILLISSIRLDWPANWCFIFTINSQFQQNQKKSNQIRGLTARVNKTSWWVQLAWWQKTIFNITTFWSMNEIVWVSCYLFQICGGWNLLRNCCVKYTYSVENTNTVQIKQVKANELKKKLKQNLILHFPL